MPIKPTLPRFSIQEVENGVQVTLPSKKNVFSLIWTGFIMLLWLNMAGAVLNIEGTSIGVATGLIGDEPPPPDGMIGFSFMLLLLIFPILAIGVILVFNFLWQIAGREIILSNPQTLTIIRKIFRWKKSREYSSELVKDLCVNYRETGYPPLRPFQMLLGRYTMIAFDYGAKTYRFGFNIEEAEAKQMIAAIQKGLEM